MARKGNAETQFKKGQSGNPAGRKKGVPSLTQTLKQMLDASELNLEVRTQMPGKLPEIKRFNIKTDHSIKYAVTMAMISQAIAGDMRAINAIWDRIEGRVETREKEKDPEKTEFENLTIEEKQQKIIELFPKVA